MGKMKTVIKYPGSKWNLADTIVSMMPEHKSYAELFFGSGAVLFTKPISQIETINDMDDEVVNLFKTIREYPTELATAIYYTPYAETEYEQAYEEATESDQVERARRFMVRSLQSHGFSMYRKVGWKIDIQGRERNYAVKQWKELPDVVHQAAERLKNVQIAHADAIELMARFNFENVFMYLDPPYIIEARTSKRKQYTHEMTEEDHVRLLQAAVESKAKIMISGYQTDLYDEVLKDWNRHEFNATAVHGMPRKEIIWTNYDGHQMTITEYLNGR